MQQKDNSDDFDKNHQNGIYLSGMSHIQENAEDVKRQQRQDDRTDHAHDDFLKVPCYTLQSIAVQCRQSQSQCEGKVNAVMTFISGGRIRRSRGECRALR